MYTHHPFCISFHLCCLKGKSWELNHLKNQQASQSVSQLVDSLLWEQLSRNNFNDFSCFIFLACFRSNFEKDWESNGESNLWCKTDGEKEDRGPDRDVGIEGNSGSDGKGKWSEVVWACAEEGWWACSEKSVGVWSEGQEEARTTKEEVEDASGEGEQERWFGEKGRHESSEMESGS